jgi:hypothetical protein
MAGRSVCGCLTEIMPGALNGRQRGSRNPGTRNYGAKMVLPSFNAAIVRDDGFCGRLQIPVLDTS